MKNMLRTTILLAAVVAIVACTQVFAADEPTTPAPPPPPAPARERTAGAPSMGGGQGMRMGGFGAPMIWQLVQRLELTEEQKTKVSDLQKASTEKTQGFRQTLMAANMKLNELALTGAAEADIRAAATEVGKIMGDQAVFQASATNEVKALLTAEQKTKLEELTKESIAQMAARRNEMRGQQQETRREVRTREDRPTPPVPAPQN
jgi:Spy/CpxP family protein refolding chaperone